MSQDLAFVELTDEAYLAPGLAVSAPTRLFCLARGKRIPAPSDSVEIRLTSLPDILPESAFFLYASDLELGFLLCAFRPYRISVFTSRKDSSVYAAFGLTVNILQKTETEVVVAAMKDLRDKFTAVYLIPGKGLATKRDSVLAQIRNLAVGVCLSHLDRGVCQPSQLPEAGDMAERLFEELVAERTIKEEQGHVADFDIPGSEAEPSEPATTKQFAGAKLDALRKYLSKTLLLPSVRAPKEKSAKAQLRNFIHGALTSLSALQKIDIDPTEKDTITEEMFQRLIDAGALKVGGTTVDYNHNAIEELANSEEAQRRICDDQPRVSAPRKDVRLTIFANSFKTYYEKVLLHSESAAKNERGLKEQIKNFVTNAITSASLQPGEAPLVSPDQVVDLVFKLLLKHRAITVSAGILKYNAAEIASLKGKQVTEIAETAFGVRLNKDPVVAEVARRMQESSRITIGELHDLCEKLLSAALVGVDNPPSNMETLIGEIIQDAIRVSRVRVALPMEVQSLTEALARMEVHRNVALVTDVQQPSTTSPTPSSLR